MAGWLRVACGVGLLGTALTCVAAPGIYTCIDAKGRRLTSDRIIPECNDREQKVMNPSGSVRATLGPSLTPQERAALEEKERIAGEEKRRQAEEKRLERALVARYPNRTVHDVERSKALRIIQDGTVTAQRYVDELLVQKKTLATEAEFYPNPSKYPAKLKRMLDENEQQIAAQNAIVAGQEAEKRRINARYDEELAKLRVLWGQAGVAAAPVPARP